MHDIVCQVGNTFVTRPLKSPAGELIRQTYASKSWSFHLLVSSSSKKFVVNARLPIVGGAPIEVRNLFSQYNFRFQTPLIFVSKGAGRMASFFFNAGYPQCNSKDKEDLKWLSKMKLDNGSNISWQLVVANQSCLIDTDVSFVVEREIFTSGKYLFSIQAEITPKP